MSATSKACMNVNITQIQRPFGVFVHRPPVNIIMGSVCGHEWSKDTQRTNRQFTVPDPRLRGTDQPNELVRIQVLVAGNFINHMANFHADIAIEDEDVTHPPNMCLAKLIALRSNVLLEY